MRDKRPVDELSVEELEQVLVLRKREERMSRYRRYQGDGRTVNSANLPVPIQHENAAIVPALVEPETYDLTVEPPQFEDQLVAKETFSVSAEPTFIEQPLPKPVKRVIDAKPAGYREKTMTQKIINWGLLALEVIFVGALAIILYRAFNGLSEIQEVTDKTQQELIAAIEQGRVIPSPTPLLSAANYILPGGHTPPDASGRGQFNVAELENLVPANVRSAVAQQVYLPLNFNYQETSNDPVTIDIPAININNASIVPGDHWESLKAGVGYRTSSGKPGSDKNVVLAGHNDIYGEIFRYLEDLEIGDEIKIRDASGRVHTYKVSATEIVDPDEVWVMNPDLGAKVTLITCYPYKIDTQRLIVFADLVQ